MPKSRRRVRVHLHLYVDGGVLGHKNPGTGVYWSMARDYPEQRQWEVLVRRSTSYDYHTNNEAEFLAVIEALKYIPTWSAQIVLVHVDAMPAATIYSDSLLIVRQITGEWKCREATLFPLFVQAREGLRACREAGVPVDFVHVPRAENVKRLGH